MGILSMSDAPSDNSGRIIAHCTSAAAAWDAMFERGIRRRSERLKDIAVYSNDDGACTEFKTQQRLAGFLEGFEMDVLHDGKAGTLFFFIYRSIAKDGGEAVQVAGVDDVRLFLDPEGNRPITTPCESNIFGAQAGHSSSFHRESAQLTIADGGAVATSGLNNRDRAAKGSGGGPF